MRVKSRMTKEILIELYINQKQTAGQLAEKFNKSEWWVLNKLREFKIPKRPKGNQGIYTIDLTGEKFGNYTVLSRGGRSATGQTRWLCRCDCGNVKDVDSTSLKSGVIKNCKKCAPSPRWTGYNEISGTYFKAIERGAKKRNLIFDIKIEDIWNLYIIQNKKCALSGIDINFIRNFSANTGAGQTASLDRIDSSKGYIINNVRWLHKNVNVMKWNMTDDYFMQLCKLIVKNNE